MEKRKTPIFSIVLYVFAGLVAVFMLCAIYNAQSYIAQQQVPFKGYEFQIINYYISSASPYGVYAIILFSLGWFFQKFSPVTKKAEPVLMDPAAYAQEGMFAQEAKEIAESENDTAAIPTAEQDVLSTEEVK